MMANKTYSGHLLCAIPFPEPKHVIDSIRLFHPNLKVTFIQTRLPQPGNQTQHLPAGNILDLAFCF
jgi:hypothetical protein